MHSRWRLQTTIRELTIIWGDETASAAATASGGMELSWIYILPSYTHSHAAFTDEETALLHERLPRKCQISGEELKFFKHSFQLKLEPGVAQLLGHLPDQNVLKWRSVNHSIEPTCSSPHKLAALVQSRGSQQLDAEACGGCQRGFRPWEDCVAPPSISGLHFSQACGNCRWSKRRKLCTFRELF
jgi:hypothetical protein